MNYRFGIGLFLALAVLGAWSFTQPMTYVPGKVEHQIYGFGAHLAPALAATSTFAHTAEGYQPKPIPPQAPAGLKPQELQAWMAMAQRHSGESELVPSFPEHYSAGIRVSCQGMTVTLKPLGSKAASAQIENGKLVYHEAYISTDSLNVVSDGRSEEFLLLHDAQAPQRFDYDISAVSGVKNISLSDNAIHFTNRQGQQMQIEAPWLIESGGKKVGNAVHWELSYPNGPTQPRLALVITNAAKLRYPVVIDPTWVVTNGGLNNGRYFHTATLLNNGRVLVAGGGGNSGYLTSTELYNPTTGAWTVAGSLNIARGEHTATLLPNGEVLVAGGIGNQNFYLESTELYNPATGAWTVTGSLNVARAQHTATLLPNGQVLVAGGDNFGDLPASVELYNPATGIWTTTGNLNTSRFGHTATLLSDGEVLVAGGCGNSGNALTSAELYNPATRTWTITGNLNTARFIHTATLLSNGQVLVAGGAAVNNINFETSAELYNPTTGTWTATGSLNNARELHTATLLPNGQVLVAGGVANLGDVANAELYNPATGSWTITGSLNTGRYNHTATLLPNGQILVAGGPGDTDALTSTELYNPATGIFSTAVNLTTAREEHTAALLPNGQVLVAGGEGISGNAIVSAELYNPANGTWTATGNLNTARFAHTFTLLPNGQVLVAGGYNFNSGVLTSTELYNPTTGIWTATGSLNTARYGHTATLLANGQVLVAGGGDNSGNLLASAELYNPATGTWTATGSLNTDRGAHTATLLPNGQVLVAGGAGNSGSLLASAELYNPATGIWTVTGNLNTARDSHTATLLPNGQVLVAGGNGNSAVLSNAELYNPANGTWTATGSLNTARVIDTATLLPNGQVLVAGGGDNSGNPLASVELYNPATALWTVTGSLNTARYRQTATLLPNGQVLVAGGGGNSGSLTSTELYNPGLGYGSATQPQLNTVSSASSTSALSVSGTNFTGISEASGGATNNSASNIPVVQLQSLANEQVVNVSLDPSQGFSSTTFTSLPPAGLVTGYALLTMFVNGTPSLSQIVLFQATQTISNFPATLTLTLGASPYTLPATTSAGLTVTYSVVSGPATVSGNTLTLTGTGTVVLDANQAGNDIYLPFSATETLTVDRTFAEWEAMFPTLTDPAAADTPEHDGVPTLLKYLYNVNPTRPMSANDRAALPLFGIANNGNLTLTYGQFGFNTGITVNVQTSTDLNTWTTLNSTQYTIQPTGQIDPNGDPYTEIEVPPNSSPQFIRLNVTQP